MGEPEPQGGRSTRPSKPADPVLSPTCPLVPSRGPIPFMYALAPEGRAIKRRLGRLLARQTRR